VPQSPSNASDKALGNYLSVITRRKATPMVLKLVLYSIALYHLGMGLGALLSERVAEQLAWSVFGIRLKLAPQASYLVKLLGVYVIAFGLVVCVAAQAPERNPALLQIIVLLYALRIANKVGHQELYKEAFQATDQRILTDVLMLAFFGGAVLLLKP
jgi:hypothetical protein